jgi:uncharacterized surface protein with fasciclin (FAS1) repeats
MRRLATLATLLVALLGGCATPSTPNTVADAAARDPQLSTLSRLIDTAGLAETLRQPGPYTVFAPSDEAFKAVPAKTLAELSANKELLRSVLSYHVLPARISSDQVTNSSAKTMQGGSLALAKSGSYVTVEDALVTQADVAAGNGVVHVIDRVLMPPKK